MSEHAAPLDALLVSAAMGPVRRFAPDSSSARWVSQLARRPGTTARRLRDLALESVRIAAGTSTLTPDHADRRFADPAWSENPMLRRTAQLYLAAGRTAMCLVEDADLEWRDAERTRFLVQNAVEAFSPTNVPLLNPSSAKAVIDTGGLSLVRGAAQFLHDMSAAPRIPEMVERAGFAVGENLAVTPGTVVFRNEVLELIQYQPQTEEVFTEPLLVVPPTINKFYAVDLAPGRSVIEHSVRQGRQMFVISWRNPDARHAAWDLETYVSSILEALAATERITHSPTTLVAGICSGGILASVTAAHLAAAGQGDRISALCLAVTVIDGTRAGTSAALAGRGTADLAKAMSRRQGYLDGRTLAEVFAWLRPSDLVWNYWVNNYLLGKRPPAFDILFWNSDTTRMSAGLHADFVDISLENLLATPGGVTVLGTPIDLSAIEVDSYVVAGVTDHITPWEACYRTTQLLGGKTRFVLSSSGHIAALINPPGSPKSRYHTHEGENPPEAAAWLAQAQSHEGTWWLDLSEWMQERSHERRAAPTELGAPDLPPLAPAPGTYVFDS